MNVSVPPTGSGANGRVRSTVSTWLTPPVVVPLALIALIAGYVAIKYIV